VKRMICVLCIIAAAGIAQQLTIQGSTTVLPVAQRAAEVYMDNNPDADITIRGGGSGTGIASLIDHSTGIANSSRPMKAKELNLARQNGVNPTATVIALDGIVIIVNPGNGVNDISKADLKNIFSGKVTSWDKVGGKAGTIVVVSRDAASGTFEVFNDKVLGGTKLTDAALMLASNQEVARAVAQTPGAIGYIGIGYASKDVKPITVEGIKATLTSVQEGSYPYSRSLYMYTDGAPSGLASRFINFILSADGQKLVQEEGFVPLP
jgi:phosphate transport system substrate-binding protein